MPMLLGAFLLLMAESAQVEPGSIGQALDQAVRETSSNGCSSAEDEILVCSQPRKTYRVDPVVLAIERELEKGPPKRELDASTTVAGGNCIGPQKCGDAVLPLVQVALAALKAAQLAAKGEDWKDAFRNGPPRYQRYLEEQARAKARTKVKVTLGGKP